MPRLWSISHKHTPDLVDCSQYAPSTEDCPQGWSSSDVPHPLHRSILLSLHLAHSPLTPAADGTPRVRYLPHHVHTVPCIPHWAVAAAWPSPPDGRHKPHPSHSVAPLGGGRRRTVVNCELQMTYYWSEYGHMVAGNPHKQDMNMAHESPSNEKTYSPGNSQLRNLELMINTIHSLSHSLTVSLPHSLTPSLPHSLTPSTCSPFLPHAHCHSLTLTPLFLCCASRAIQVWFSYSVVIVKLIVRNRAMELKFQSGIIPFIFPC